MIPKHTDKHQKLVKVKGNKKATHEQPLKGLKGARTVTPAPVKSVTPVNPLVGLQDALKAEQVAALAARLASGG